VYQFGKYVTQREQRILYISRALRDILAVVVRLGMRVSCTNNKSLSGYSWAELKDSAQHQQRRKAQAL